MDREEVIITPIGYLVISTTGLNIQTTEYSVAIAYSVLLPVQIMLQFGKGGGIISLCPSGGVRTLLT